VVHPVRTAALLLCGLLCAAPRAQAFALRTAFTDPCHESIALYAWSRYLVDLPLEDVPLPPAGAWRALADELARTYALSPETDAERLVLLSLLLGVRAPDSEGYALTDLENIRVVHAHPDAQSPHALRRVEDDGPAGNAAALEAARAFVRAQVKLAKEALGRPGPEQFVSARASLDYYGTVEVPTWAPVFHLGQALHAVQDSFAHSLRAEDNQRVLHVLNYVEAIHGTLLEERDGLPHSQTLDTCGVGNAPLVQAAADASLDFLVAALGEELLGGDTAAVDVVLDRWMTPTDGCTAANRYCDAPWLTFASQDLTRPYLARAFGCSAAGEAPGALAAVALLLVAAFRRRTPALAAACALLLGAPTQAGAQGRPATPREVLEATGLVPVTVQPGTRSDPGPCAAPAPGTFAPAVDGPVTAEPAAALRARCDGVVLQVDVRPALTVQYSGEAARGVGARTRWTLEVPAGCVAALGAAGCAALSSTFPGASCRPARGRCLCVQRQMDTWTVASGAWRDGAGGGAPAALQACGQEARWQLMLPWGTARWTERWTAR
jgi:uncharacterized protein (TIGR03382 family)